MTTVRHYMHTPLGVMWEDTVGTTGAWVKLKDYEQVVTKKDERIAVLEGKLRTANEWLEGYEDEGPCNGRLGQSSQLRELVNWIKEEVPK